MISTPKPRLSLFKLYESPEFGIGGNLLLLLLFFRLDLGIGKEFGEGKIFEVCKNFQIRRWKKNKNLLLFSWGGKNRFSNSFSIIYFWDEDERRIEIYYKRLFPWGEGDEVILYIRFKLSLFHPKNPNNNVPKMKPAHQLPINSPPFYRIITQFSHPAPLIHLRILASSDILKSN